MSRRYNRTIIVLIIILCILILLNIFMLVKGTIRLHELENTIQIEQEK